MSEPTGISPSDVDAVVVNFNGGDALLGCLASLRAASASRIIVVDNSSKDGSIDAVTSTFPEIEVLRAGRNLGYGSAANRGARLGQAPYLVISNPDVTVGPDSINRLVQTLERATDAAAAGPLITDVEGRPYPSARSFPDFVTGAAHAFVGLFAPHNRWSRRYRAERGASDTGGERECDWVSGAFVVFRRTAFESVGGFDERYFMYVEDL
ncbi:MAG TPA: glycosyltransferase family 2 protein, partial [Acidimicrobiales bacterium]|nr:glycosyltransferase family 2 protein [Acidimicrobiales bacterium]